MADIAQRFAENPILKPADIRPSSPGMRVECLLNPGRLQAASDNSRVDNRFGLAQVGREWMNVFE
jgi:hypothetical protein